MAGLSKVGKKGLQDGALTTTAASAPTVGAKGELFYNTAENKLYVSNGTAWTRVSNDAPSSTGGTVVISTLNEGATFSYNLGTNFTDDSNTDAELTYSLESGTLPGGATLPTAGNSAMTGTVGNVSSNTVYTFSIRATDAAGATATQDYQQQINTVVATTTGGTVTISSVNEGSSASYDVNTNFTFTAGSAFSAYSLASGTLPSGLSLNTSTGVISGTMGTVSADTAYSFSIRGTDTDGDTVDQGYSWTIIEPFSATGGTITTYSGYRVHTFTSSGAITFNKSGTVDVLVVAGGGAGGTNGGGGGAGGYRLVTNNTVASGSLTVTIGSGGSGKSYSCALGYSGNNSVFNGITSNGGGVGGSCAAGASGGSGGGGGYTGTNIAVAGGSGTSGQGNNGGIGNSTTAGYGGGGGAGAVGQGGTGANAGGVGLQNNYRTGSNIYYAGGGGGGRQQGSPAGSGGTGGGGNGNTVEQTAYHATVNTGGGGGGSGGGSGVSGNGGSGIVVIRYAV